MSSRITIILAGFFLIGALLAGYWGLVLSRPPAEPVAVAAAPAPAATAVQVWKRRRMKCVNRWWCYAAMSPPIPR